jgi:probable HAF family extracellular repeat protein
MYDIVDLDYGIAYAVNNQGHVAGFTASRPGGAEQAYIYQSATKTMLGHLATGGGAVARAINESDAVVGFGDFSFFQTHPILWSSNSVTDLGTLGGNEARAKAINSSGFVVGNSEIENHDGSTSRGFIWSNGQMTMIPVLSGNSSSADDINASGTVVGTYRNSSGVPHGYTWRLGETPDDIGEVYPVEINDSGHIAALHPSGSILLVVNGQTTDLGKLNGMSLNVNDMNNGDEIVGSNATQNVAFIASGGVIRDLNELIQTGTGWQLQVAYGINDSGWIVGFGLLNGSDRAFLLIPRP